MDFLFIILAQRVPMISFHARPLKQRIRLASQGSGQRGAYIDAHDVNSTNFPALS